MDKDTLIRLEKLNQLRLDEKQTVEVLSFFAKRDAELTQLDAIDTANVERMVHVQTIRTAIREDVAQKLFEREELQKGAPETADGYWQVPRLVE